MKKWIFFIVGFSLIFSQRAFALEIKSNAFKNNESIPQKYTCKGEDISPPLFWSDVPSGVKSFVLICDDPDAPVGTWDHWVIYNIPSDRVTMEENIPKIDQLPDGSLQGKNGWDKVGYGGPCPPPGKPHRYFFKLYALDIMLDLKAGAVKNDVLKAMEGHILDQAEIIGIFKR